jgi:hypothetical protein
VGLFDQIVAASGRHDLDVLHGVEHGKFSESCPIAPELVGMDHLRHVVFPQQSLEERSGGLGVAVFLEEDVQHGPVFVDGAPQPLFDTAYIDGHFIKVPSGTTSWFPMTQTLGEKVAEVDAPGPDGLACHGHAPFQQEFFDVSVAEREAVVEPDSVPDDREGESVPRELLTTQHRVTLPQQLATTVYDPQARVSNHSTPQVHTFQHFCRHEPGVHPNWTRC